jgi:hypothetical protein
MLIAFGRGNFGNTSLSMRMAGKATIREVVRIKMLLEALGSAVPAARDGSHATSSGWLPESEARTFVRFALADAPEFSGDDPWEVFEKYVPDLVLERIILTCGRLPE